MAKLALGQKLFGLSLNLMPPTHRLPVNLVRRLFYWTDKLNDLPRIPLAAVDTLNIPVTTNGQGKKIPSEATQPDDQNNAQGQIQARIYWADSTREAVAGTKHSELPTIVFFHSGGCVIGSVETHDGFCRHLAHYGQINVVSVDYRLAPEHKFPAAICDAIEAWNWVSNEGDKLGLNTQNMGVAGDSAGGYLSLIVSLLSLQTSLPVCAQRKPDFQALMFPMLDLRANRPSYDAFTSSLLLTKSVMLYFRDHYLNDLDEVNLPLASPILSDVLSEAPPTYLLTVEYDPLRDEGLELAEKLAQANVEVQHEHAADCMHSFFSLTRVSPTARDRTRTTIEQIGGFANRFAKH